MTLKNIDKFFAGYIEYKTLEGEVLTLEYVEAGKVVGRYKLSDRTSFAAKSSATTQSCQTVCTPKYGTSCVSLPEHSEGMHCGPVIIGEDCKEVCTDNNPAPNHPSPGGGGNPNTPTIPAAETEALITQIFDFCDGFKKGSDNYQEFLSAMQYAVNGNSGQANACFMNRMLGFLAGGSNSFGKITVCINSSLTQAGYDPKLKMVSFRNQDNIESVNIFHELFHACQDRIYPNGIEQYRNKDDIGAIEFEAYLFIDIVGRLAGSTPSASRDEDYRSFINNLTTDNNGNRNLYNAKNYFNSLDIPSGYIFYKEKFKQYKTTYIESTTNLPPLTIQYFLNNFNCYL